MYWDGGRARRVHGMGKAVMAARGPHSDKAKPAFSSARTMSRPVTGGKRPLMQRAKPSLAS